jgi:hypothetical protein
MKQQQKKTLKNSICLTLACGLLTLLTACPIEKDPPIDPPPPPPPPTPTLALQIKALEDSGAYPKLDRSADLKGPDQNLNGVRDDIDAWISTLPITDVQKKAATQKAEVFQKTLFVDLTDKVALQVVGDGLMASTFCLADVYEPKMEEGFKLASKIEALTFNTKQRAMRYIQYNKARSGSVTSAPTGNTCK